MRCDGSERKYRSRRESLATSVGLGRGPSSWTRGNSAVTEVVAAAVAALASAALVASSSLVVMALVSLRLTAGGFGRGALFRVHQRFTFLGH